MQNRIEALVDAIGAVNGMSNPESEAYQCRNPLLLKAWSLHKPEAMNDRGVRLFDTLLAGYQVGVRDAWQKCSGNTRARSVETGSRLRSYSELWELLVAYELRKKEYFERVSVFVNCAIGQGEVDARTPLNWFTQDAAMARTAVREAAYAD